MSSSDDEEEENDVASTSDSSDEQNEWHLDEDLGYFESLLIQFNFYCVHFWSKVMFSPY